MLRMNMSRYLLAPALFGLLVPAWAGTLGLGMEGREPMKIVELHNPIHPRSLMEVGVSKGYAEVLMKVDEAGQLEDWFVTAYSHKEFADSVVRAMKTWKFMPATMNGEAIGAITQVRFVFEAVGTVITQNAATQMDAYRYRIEKLFSYKLAGLKDIDRLPVPVTMPSPAYPEKLSKRGGQVLLDFIIDETGKVRLPSVVSADHAELAELASMAVKNWTFEPPRQKGRPVAVRVQQRFDF